MKKLLKIILALFAIVILACAISFFTDKTTYSNWEIKTNPGNIFWARFQWTDGNLGGKQFDKLSMNIPCRMPGFDKVFTFQFDLGASLTGVYETTFLCLNEKPTDKIKRLRSRLQFWNNNRYFDNMTLSFGDYVATNKIAYLFQNYGSEETSDTIHLGTIGADLFQNKILLIDYPNTRFAICDNVPEEYKTTMIDIELDKRGRVILPMKMNGHAYRVMFDNGSSIFPLITRADNIAKFATGPDIDTIPVSSWGNQHAVTGKSVTDTFELAGYKFANTRVYANHSGHGIDTETDAMTGNALFWDKTVMIDFKNKKFGLR